MAARSNEELVREGFLAFSEGRFEDCLETLHPDIEWHIAFKLPDLPPDQRMVRGHQEVLDVWRLFAAVWESLVFEPEEIVHDAGETVIVRIGVHGVGRDSHVAVDRTIHYVGTIRDGLLVRLEPFDSLEEARAAIPRGPSLPSSPLENESSGR